MNKLWSLLSTNFVKVLGGIVVIVIVAMLLIGSFLISKEIKLDDININTQITIDYPDDDDDDEKYADNETRPVKK